MSGRRFAAALAIFVLVMASTAYAHTRSVSYSTWRFEGRDAEVRVKLARLDLSAEPRFARTAAGELVTEDDDRQLQRYLVSHVRLTRGGRPCTLVPGSYARIASAVGFLERAWRLHCSSDGAATITASLLVGVLPSHQHFAAITERGTTRAERLLTLDAPRWDVPADAASRAASSTGFVAFVGLGLHHVATGADHLVFVLVLLVAARSLRSVVAVVTGFTVGHSITLALAVFGAVRPESANVEALVGASIAVVAVENVWLERRDPWLAAALVTGLLLLALVVSRDGRGTTLALAGLALFVACHFGLMRESAEPARQRAWVAALFGTVHGLAFSEVLAEMHLPRARLASALFGFNLGVEFAQLAVVLVAWPLVRWLARSPGRAIHLELASASALAAGTFWLVERSLS